MSDWWSTLDSEQSQNEVIQMGTSHPTSRVPEVALSLYEHDGLCVTVCKGKMSLYMVYRLFLYACSLSVIGQSCDSIIVCRVQPHKTASNFVRRYDAAVELFRRPSG